LVAAGGLAAAAAVGLAVYLSRLAGRLSARARLVVERRTAFQSLLFSVAAIAVLEAISYNVRNPWLWEREIRSVPLAFSIVRPEAELASFRISLRRTPSARERAAAVAVPPLEEKPDVIVFVVESLRKDVVTPEVMPRLSAFAADAWTFEHPITSGNVTQYSWYGLFCAELPIYFEAARASPAGHGSVPLAVLRRLGYQIHLFATPNTEYQGIQDVVFGDGQALLDTKFHPEAPEVAERDQAVVSAFARAMASQPRGGGVYVVALDSSHFDYSWGAGFQPPFQPFAAGASTVSHEVDAWARAALQNRYRDAVAWVDLLLGQALEAVQASGRMGSSYVVVTGDHGEAFWEHGSGTHGTDLSREQVEVGFAMKVPGAARRHFDAVFSLMDVMPTVLHGLGFRQADLFEGVPVQSRLPPGGQDTASLGPRAALTFQGVNERGYRFALTTRDERIIFELDRRNPLESKRLSIKDVTDLDDVSFVDGEARDAASAYDRLLREIPHTMDELPFLGP
jgi:glucan phosphoethanolaminetransferase (alkaline phosphatase superfamily)